MRKLIILVFFVTLFTSSVYANEIIEQTIQNEDGSLTTQKVDEFGYIIEESTSIVPASADKETRGYTGNDYSKNITSKETVDMNGNSDYIGSRRYNGSGKYRYKDSIYYLDNYYYSSRKNYLYSVNLVTKEVSSFMLSNFSLNYYTIDETNGTAYIVSTNDELIIFNLQTNTFTTRTINGITSLARSMFKIDNYLYFGTKEGITQKMNLSTYVFSDCTIGNPYNPLDTLRYTNYQQTDKYIYHWNEYNNLASATISRISIDNVRKGIPNWEIYELDNKTDSIIYNYGGLNYPVSIHETDVGFIYTGIVWRSSGVGSASILYIDTKDSVIYNLPTIVGIGYNSYILYDGYYIYTEDSSASFTINKVTSPHFYFLANSSTPSIIYNGNSSLYYSRRNNTFSTSFAIPNISEEGDVKLTFSPSGYYIASTLKPFGLTVIDSLHTYTIKYETNGGPLVDDYVGIGRMTLPSPTKTGYLNYGWYSDVTLTNKVGSVGATYTPTDNITLYCKWVPITYYIYYDANGGSGTMSYSSHTYDTAENLSANKFVRAGYDFIGWSTSATDTTIVYNDKQEIFNLSSTDGYSTRLYAVWKSNSQTKTGTIVNQWKTPVANANISYNGQDVITDSTGKFTVTSTFSLTEIPLTISKEGYYSSILNYPNTSDLDLGELTLNKSYFEITGKAESDLGELLANVYVKINDSITAQTDLLGNYKIQVPIPQD